jgi:hypothetical protein
MALVIRTCRARDGVLRFCPDGEPMPRGTARHLRRLCMQTNIDESILTNETWRAGVLRANKVLESELGPAAHRVTADWSLTHDERNHPLLTLVLSDSAESASARFPAEELSDRYRVQARLQRLWGDLLQVRSHKQLRKLSALLNEPEGG